MNVAFVNYHDFTSNSAVHIARLADELTAAGDECAVLVPGNPETITLLGKHRFQALDIVADAHRELVRVLNPR